MTTKKIEKTKEKRGLALIEDINKVCDMQNALIVSEMNAALANFEVTGSTKLPCYKGKDILFSDRIIKMLNVKNGRTSVVSSYELNSTEVLLYKFSLQFEKYRTIRDHVLEMYRILLERSEGTKLKKIMMSEK